MMGIFKVSNKGTMGGVSPNDGDIQRETSEDPIIGEPTYIQWLKKLSQCFIWLYA
jgi:hypothetical protein